MGKDIKNKNKQTNKNVFNQDDYNSGDGMLTSVWGPSLWHVLHTISFNYPVKPTQRDKKYYFKFIMSLQNVLPCRYCRENLKNNLKCKDCMLTKNKLKNRDIFSRWMYELHEKVNTMLGKKSNLTFDQVRNRYENFRSRCSGKKNEVPLNLKTNINKSKKENNNTANVQINEKIKENINENINKKMKENIKEKKIKEKGCTKPLYGVKSKCIIKIVPKEDTSETFQMDKRCVWKRKMQ
jgi:hypothetical protein